MQSRIAILAVMMLAPAVGAGAQPSRDFQFNKTQNPALGYGNAAFLSTLNQKQFSMVDIHARKDNGGLTSLEKSDDSFEAGAQTESYIKVSDRIAFSGRLSYSYFKGNNMGAQILLDPEYNPVNFQESADDTRGIKVKECYNLSGGMSYRFNERWSGGIKANYQSADMAKRKDPRYRNTWMSLDLSAGVSFKSSKKTALGLSLEYRNTVEKVYGATFGKTDKSYYYFVDRGGFWGTSEMLAGDQGAIAKGIQRPMVNSFYGGAFQFSYTGKNKFYNELSLLYRNGFYGKKESSTPMFFEFSGLCPSYSGTALLYGRNNLSKITLDASLNTLDNYENNFKYITPIGGTTYIEYSGQKIIMNRMDVNARLGYTFYQAIDADLPEAEYGAEMSFHMHNQKTTVYPYWRNNDHFNMEAAAWAKLNLAISRKSYITPYIRGSFFTGSGTAFKDGANTTEKSKNLKSFDLWLFRQFEYDTASRACGTLSITYTRLFSKLSVYITASDCFTGMFSEPEYLTGRTRNVALLTIGCNF